MNEINTQPRIAILISGRGSNMNALLSAWPQIPATLALVFSNKASAAGLATARNKGVPVAIGERHFGQNKSDHEAAMLSTLKRAGVSHLILAGFMPLLTQNFLDHFEATLNIHPSLLPSFPGLNTHERVIAAGEKVHGCTVHVVDAGVDTGPIVAQAALQVREGETVETLSARVLRLEHALYPVALANFLMGKKRNQGLADPRVRGY